MISKIQKNQYFSSFEGDFKVSRNIEMNYFNGSGYEQLYPRTNMSNISDWNSYVYSKSQVDNTVSGINNSIEDINNNIETINNNISNINNNYKVVKIGSYILTNTRAELFNMANYIEYEFIIVNVLSNVTANYSYISAGGVTFPVYNFKYNAVFIRGCFLNVRSNYEVSASLQYSGFVYYDNYDIPADFPMETVYGSIIKNDTEVGTDIRSTLDFYAVKIA